mmetsp:Transcript_10269/g.22028  ORF Transcript_10269/g.22028 Transcript_10269/m.22028 type:complete len:81 (-) Transcript_10269:1151-1393(-)
MHHDTHTRTRPHETAPLIPHSMRTAYFLLHTHTHTHTHIQHKTTSTKQNDTSHVHHCLHRMLQKHTSSSHRHCLHSDENT